MLAGPIATSVFPELSGRDDRFDATTATSTRSVTVASWLGVAGMAGTCVPLARVFQSHVDQAADARQLAIALAVFAPGLVGYGLTTNLSRVLYACGRSRAAALADAGASPALGAAVPTPAPTDTAAPRMPPTAPPQGGCAGCTVGTTDASSAGALAALLGIALARLRRKKG